MPSFEELMLPHLPTAFNLARWLLRNEHDAEDSVQEAYLRALQVFSRFRGTDGRAWLLCIVRNICYDRLRRLQRSAPTESFDEELPLHSLAAPPLAEAELAQVRAGQLSAALAAMPDPLREVIVLHELEGFAYREIAEIAEIPIGTVMSRLARARARLQLELTKTFAETSDS